MKRVHHEQPEREDRVSFPGEVVMPQGLIPAAIWLGAQEYSESWRWGGDGWFRGLDISGGWATAILPGLMDRSQYQPAWRPLWYKDNFVDCAVD